MGSEIVFAVLLVAGLLILLLLGLEIGWSIGIVAVVGLTWYIDQPISQVAETAWSSLNSFTLTAMPLFIFMGTILGNTGVNERLFAAIEKWFGHFPGGLAISVIAGNAVFGAMCGSAMAATATFGKIAFPVMEKKGYSPRLALGAIATADILSPLIRSFPENSCASIPTEIYLNAAEASAAIRRIARININPGHPCPRKRLFIFIGRPHPARSSRPTQNWRC